MVALADLIIVRTARKASSTSEKMVTLIYYRGIEFIGRLIEISKKTIALSDVELTHTGKDSIKDFPAK
jgi:hypothetical protein